MPALNPDNLIKDVSKISNGFQLSPNLLLEHMSSGAFHKVLGKWIPQFPTAIVPWMSNGIFSQNFPLLQMVQNLQLSSNGLVENLITQIGGQLNIQAGFLNNTPLNKLVNEAGHVAGISVDIAVNGFQTNPLHIVKDIQKLATSASSVNMVFGTGMNGYFHINFDANKFKNDIYDLPIIKSVDMATGEVVSGIAALRGYS